MVFSALSFSQCLIGGGGILPFLLEFGLKGGTVLYLGLLKLF